jgi:nucleoside-diphosphate-sugar epimerase
MEKSVEVGVIGAGGFVGSAFARLLEARSIPCRRISREDYSQSTGDSFDILINANGNSRKYIADQDPRLDFNLSVRSVVESLFDFKYRLYVLISTVDVYNTVSDPSANSENAPLHPETLSNYGFHKLMAERLVQRYAPEWLIIRLAGMVGPGLKKNPVYDLLHGISLRVHPDSAYQFMNTEDIARIVWELASGRHRREVFNVCGEGVIALHEVQEMLGLPYSDNGLKKERYEINIEKAKKLFSMPRTVDTVREFVNKK